MATIQEVYIALFGRPADPLGYQYYVEATDDGANLDAVGDLSGSEEYGARFEGMTTVQMINQIYLDLFNRDADAAGLTFYFNLISSGEASFQDIAIRILDGATGTDREIVDNKVLAAQLFTDSLDTGAEIAAYQGDAAADAGRTFLTGITEDPATIPSQEDTDTFIAGIVDGSIGGGSGATVALTDAIGEAVEGTNGNDTFTGVLGDGSDGTFQFGDQVNGLTGTDTLNIFTTAAVGDYPAGAELNSVEIINLNQDNGVVTNLDATDFGAAAQQIWQIDVATDITGLGDGQTAGFRDADADVTVTGTGAVVNIALDNVDDVSDLIVDGADVATINLSGSVADPGNVSLTAGADLEALITVNAAMTSDAIINADGLFAVETFTTFDASASTGGITFSTDSGNNFVETVLGGSGDDDLYFDLDFANNGDGGVAVTIDAGDGIDIVSFAAYANTDASTASITLGAGADTLALTESFENVNDADEADFAESLITVEDFDGAEDVFDISALGLTLADINNVEAADIADSEDLFEAIETAAALIDFAGLGEDAIVFEFDGSTYLLGDSDNDSAFTDDDGLIELTGVAVADLTAASFVTA